jgi:hypothetical protein
MFDINTIRMKYKLMVKKHAITGLKYLCMTIKKDWQSYRGSGVYWKSHLREHGREHVITELIFETDDHKEFKKRCLVVSDSLDVVKSEEYANLMPETGELGGKVFSTQTQERQIEIREKCRSSQSRAPRSLKVRTAISETKLKRTPEQKEEWRKKIRKHFSDGLNAEHFEKMKITRCGAGNPAAKRVKIDGTVYESISEAMNATGLKRHTITDRCKSDKFPTYERL